MIFRNSIKSILRTPVKTILFTLLIAAVTAFFYLGVNTWVSSTAMLRDCDENYTTVVSIEYVEDSGSTKGFKSDSMISNVSAIDFDAIAANKYMLQWQPADMGPGVVDGFTTRDQSADFKKMALYVVTGLKKYAEDSNYAGRLLKVLYSSATYSEGRTIFVNLDPAEFDFEIDQNAIYLIHAYDATGNAQGTTVHVYPFYTWVAQEAGIDCASVAKMVELESVEDLARDDLSIYQTIADYYQAVNNALTVRRVQDVGVVEEFSQNYVELTDGRLFTKEESEAGENLCVVSVTLANNRDLKVGDTLTLRRPDDPYATIYAWGDTMSREETYTIVGIFNYNADYHLNVYTTAIPESNTPLRYMDILGQATIKNGTSAKFIEELKTLLPEEVYISVNDQGYQTTANALMVIQKAAIVLSIVALIVTFVVLAFFAYLFSDTQREAVEIMRCFGGKKGEVRRYLMIGVTLIALVAIVVGLVIGVIYADRLVQYAYSFISELQVVDLRYSDGFRGFIKEFTPIVALSYPLAATVGFGVLLSALGFCIYYSERIVSGKLITSRAKSRVRRSPKKSSVALRGWLRQAVLLIRRSGIRSALVPLLCAAALLFVSSLQTTLDSYYEAEESLYENTTLSGYAAQMNGKYSGGLYIANNVAKKLVNLSDIYVSTNADTSADKSGHATKRTDGVFGLYDYENLIDDVTYTYTMHYSYLGIEYYADGSYVGADYPPYPQNSFEREALLEKFYTNPNIIFTNSIKNAPEFFFSDFNCTYMRYWNEERFARRDWEITPCVVTTRFMKENKIRLGDIIRVYVEPLQPQSGFYDDSAFLGLTLQVVGSFTSVSNQDNIYCALPSGALSPETSRLRELSGNANLVQTGKYYNYWGPGRPRWSWIMPHVVDVLLDTKWVTSMTFTIPNARNLTQIKDLLYETGLSGPALSNNYRVCIVIEDSQFSETLSSIAQRTKFLEILYPILLVLVGTLGIITGFLSVNSRREDIALMRGLGVRKRRIFCTIFGEQILLLLIGLLPAAAGWYFLKGAEQLLTISAYMFFICYAAGATLSALQQNAKKALTILSEKE